MAYPAKAIANFFISKSITDPKTPLTPLKVIKLVYVAHGWYLAMKNIPLITEEVEAWKYGPVIPSLYQAFKQYGNNPITQLAEIDEISPTDEYTLQFLNEVWEKYGNYTGLQLSSWTHRESSPWYITWETEKRREMGDCAIEDELIKNYFKNMQEAKVS